MKKGESLRLGIIGYGKMGKAIEQIALQQGHRITLIVDQEKDRNKIREHKDDLDVVVEFTSGDAAFDNIYSCLEAGIPVVSGSTGWLDRLPAIEAQVKRTDGAFFYASNFSVGVYLFMKAARHLAHLMNAHPDYDVLIDEAHHIHKKDAPSGTALSLITQVTDELSRKTGWTLDSHHAGATEIPVLAKRLGMEFGHHKLTFHSEIDTISIEHRAFSRDGFAQGAVKAAEYLYGKKGIFGMHDMLG